MGFLVAGGFVFGGPNTTRHTVTAELSDKKQVVRGFGLHPWALETVVM